MNELNCCIVKDLLPLYIDDVLSPQSRQLVQDHLARCECCQAEQDRLRQELILPSTPDIQAENAQVLTNFQKKWTTKKIVISLVSALLAVVLFFPVRNAIMESELFSPVTRAYAGTVGQTYLGELSNGRSWTRLWLIHQDLFSNATTFQEPYLIFDNIFYERKAINSGNSISAIEMRILDQDGNVVIAPFLLEPGRAVSLEQLEYFTPYIVEYRAKGDYYEFSFR